VPNTDTWEGIKGSIHIRHKHEEGICNVEMYTQIHSCTFTYRHIHIREDKRKNQVPIEGEEVYLEASMNVCEEGGKCV